MARDPAHSINCEWPLCCPSIKQIMSALKDKMRIAAPPAQTALTDDARECLMDVVSHHHDFRTACLEIKMASETTVSDELYWQKQIDVLDRMKGQAERALTAAQSASGEKI